MAKFEDHLKVAAMTGAEIGVFGAGAVVANQFGHAGVVFKSKMDADPKFCEQPICKYWGGLKFVAACLASSMIENPWAKMFILGGGFQGALEQFNALQDDDTKKKMIGAGSESDLDTKLKELAEKYQASAGSYMPSSVGEGASSVGSEYWRQDSPTGVGSDYSAVGWEMN